MDALVKRVWPPIYILNQPPPDLHTILLHTGLYLFIYFYPSIFQIIPPLSADKFTIPVIYYKISKQLVMNLINRDHLPALV